MDWRRRPKTVFINLAQPPFFALREHCDSRSRIGAWKWEHRRSLLCGHRRLGSPLLGGDNAFANWEGSGWIEIVVVQSHKRGLWGPSGKFRRNSDSNRSIVLGGELHSLWWRYFFFR